MSLRVYPVNRGSVPWHHSTWKMARAPWLRFLSSLATQLKGQEQEVAADRFPKPRIVLADANQRMREAVARVLKTECEVEVVGCALDGAGAVDAAIGLRPDILILDIIMPGLDGIRVARMLRRVDSPTKIIFLTGIEDSSFRQAAMEAGGQAYVFKASAFTDLPRAITAVMTGATFLSSKGTPTAQ